MMAKRVSGVLNLSYTDLYGDHVLCPTSLLAFNISWCLQFLRPSGKLIMDSLAALLKV